MASSAYQRRRISGSAGALAVSALAANGENNQHDKRK